MGRANCPDSNSSNGFWTSSSHDTTSSKYLSISWKAITTRSGVANSRGDVKAITTRSGVAYDGPTIPPTPSPL
ncbi:hypothetical protein Tco_0985640, partial [Tanacetum coccineum]